MCVCLKKVTGNENPEGGKGHLCPSEHRYCQWALVHGRLAPTQCGVTQPGSTERTRPRRPAPAGPPQPYLVGPLDPLHIREVDLGKRSPEGELDSTASRPWRPSSAALGFPLPPHSLHSPPSALPPRPAQHPPGTCQEAQPALPRGALSGGAGCRQPATHCPH